MLVFSIVYPASETAAGGNYNLRFLSADARRRLRPEIPRLSDQSPARDAGNESTPLYGLLPSAPYSVYLLKAGFLWTDHLVWDETSGAFEQDYVLAKMIEEEARFHEKEDADESARKRSIGHRAIFFDKINIVEPWVLERYNRPTLLDSEYLWPGEPLYLRSYTTGEYLSAEPDVPSILDDEQGWHGEEEGFRRLHVR